MNQSSTKSEKVPSAQKAENRPDKSSIRNAPTSSAYKKAILSFDNLGILASMICLVHCLAMPFVVALLPFLGLSFLESHESHMWLGLAIITFALVAIVPSYMKHKKPSILAGMLIGIGLVIVGGFFSHELMIHEHEMNILIAGNLTLVVTHLLNKRVYGCCEETH